MLVTLIRHGQIPANIDKKYIGKTNELLTDIGKEQAALAKEKLAQELDHVDKVFTSPLTRCIQTADILFPNMQKVVVEDFREMDFGIFEGKNANQMVDFKPYRDWVDSMCMDKIPEGESMQEFDDRCCGAFEEIIKSCTPTNNIAIVVHGGTIMSIMGRFNDEGRQYFEYHLNNCVFYICECSFNDDGKPVLHLVGGAKPLGGVPPKDW